MQEKSDERPFRSSKNLDKDLQKKNRRLIFKYLAIIVLVVCLVAASLSFNKLNNMLNKFNKGDMPSVKKVGNIQEMPFSILLIGLGTNGEDGQATLADSINIITINPKNKYAEVIAIPRDSYVPFGASCEWGIGMFDKITHTTGVSPECLQTTVQDLFQIDINYFVSLNFKGFVQIVDALGGVEMNVPDLREGFNNFPGDPDDGMYLDPSLKNGKQWCEHDSNRTPFAVCFSEFGKQNVNGEQALALARSRHYDSDYGRSYRQTELIKAIIKKATDIKNIGAITNVIEAAGETVQTNVPTTQYMSFIQLATALFQAKDANGKESFIMRTTQLAGRTYAFNGQRISGQNINYSVVPVASVQQIREKLQHALSDGEVVISPGDFDFSTEPDSTPSTYSYDETIDKSSTFMKDN